VVTAVEIEQLRIYGYVIGTGLLVIVLYSYIIYLYRSEKKGEKDYEKYSKLALDDELDSDLLEKHPKLENDKKE
jgi:cytochrome c oxidase cbb3-type subunit 4